MHGLDSADHSVVALEGWRVAAPTYGVRWGHATSKGRVRGSMRFWSKDGPGIRSHATKNPNVTSGLALGTVCFVADSLSSRGNGPVDGAGSRRDRGAGGGQAANGAPGGGGVAERAD